MSHMDITCYMYKNGTCIRSILSPREAVAAVAAPRRRRRAARVAVRSLWMLYQT